MRSGRLPGSKRRKLPRGPSRRPSRSSAPPRGPLAGRVGVDGLGRFGWDVRPLTRCLSVVRLVGKRWPVEYRRRVLEELEPTIEDPAVNHLERNIGVPVEDPVPAGGAGDHREDHHPEAIYQASAEQRSAQSEAAEGA